MGGGERASRAVSATERVGGRKGKPALPPAHSPVGQRIHSLPCFLACEVTGDATSDQKELGTHSLGGGSAHYASSRAPPPARTHRTARARFRRSFVGKGGRSERAARERSPSLPLSFLPSVRSRWFGFGIGIDVLDLHSTLPTAPAVPPFLRPFVRSSFPRPKWSLMAFQFSKFKGESGRPKGKSVVAR